MIRLHSDHHHGAFQKSKDTLLEANEGGYQNLGRLLSFSVVSVAESLVRESMRGLDLGVRTLLDE